MRISALMSLMILSVMAGCGDDDKGDDKDKDEGANNGSNSSEDEQFDAGGKLPGINDDNLDDCDKGDPCCINSDEFDFTRCSGKPDAGPTEE